METNPPVEVWPGSGSILEAIPDGWHSTGQTARLIGRSKETLKTWARNGTYSPGGYMVCGKLVISLYNDNDIAALKDIAGSKHAGRPRKEKGETSSRTGDV